MTFIIQDWTGRVCFDGREFASFDDAEDFLSEKLGDAYETDRGEYYIEVWSDRQSRGKRYLDPFDPRA